MNLSVKQSALKRLKDTYKSDDVVLPSLERHVMRVIGESNENSDRSKLMHPSDMCKPDWCGRHDFYRIKGTRVEKESKANPSFRMENVFAEGHSIHGKYQTWLWEMGVLYGNWLCLSCKHTWEALSPDICPVCSSPRLAYREVGLHRNGYHIEGHADGAVHDLDGWTGLIEIKSIGVGTLAWEAPRLYNRYLDGETLETLWFKINRPFVSHLKQGMLYLWLSWPRYEQIAFIYESKFHQQTKEFLVSYNPLLIASVLETAKEVSQCVRADQVPDRPVWAEDINGKICKSCEYRRTCWGGDRGPAEEDHPKTVVRIKRTKSVERKRVLSQAHLRPA